MMSAGLGLECFVAAKHYQIVGGRAVDEAGIVERVSCCWCCGVDIYKKHFTKMQKHVGLASTKNQPNKMGLT